jgi:hypothetical protein
MFDTVGCCCNSFKQPASRMLPLMLPLMSLIRFHFRFLFCVCSLSLPPFSPAVDTTAPNITVPADTTLPADGQGPDRTTIVEYTASATDLVDGTVTVTCNPSSGSGFALGPTEVTCSAQDERGNNATKSFTVTLGESFCPGVHDCAQFDEGRGGVGSPNLGWAGAVWFSMHQIHVARICRTCCLIRATLTTSKHGFTCTHPVVLAVCCCRG